MTQPDSPPRPDPADPAAATPRLTAAPAPALPGHEAPEPSPASPAVAAAPKLSPASPPAAAPEPASAIAGTEAPQPAPAFPSTEAPGSAPAFSSTEAPEPATAFPIAAAPHPAPAAPEPPPAAPNPLDTLTPEALALTGAETPLETRLLALATLAGPDSSIAPAEVAQSMNPANWRPLLTAVTRAALRLQAAGRIAILRKGKPVPAEAVRGVIRFRITPA